VVGPFPGETDNRDWLQLHSHNWEPLAREKWLALGRRHLLGALGNSVDLQLTFRDAAGHQDTDIQEPRLEELVHFDYAVRCAAPNAVFLNVFDLASALSIPNAVLCNTVISTVGAFHAAVEVYREEWSFYRTPNPSSCGVCKSMRPRHHPVHVYRQSINLGQTTLKDWEVRYLIRGVLASKWPGSRYDLLHQNCIHFCDELLLSLGVKPVPNWVKGLHETGASVLRWPWPLSLVMSGGTDGPVPIPVEDKDGQGNGNGTSHGNGHGHASDAARAPIDPGEAPADGTFVVPDVAGEPAAELQPGSSGQNTTPQTGVQTSEVAENKATENPKVGA